MYNSKSMLYFVSTDIVCYTSSLRVIYYVVYMKFHSYSNSNNDFTSNTRLEALLKFVFNKQTDS